MRLFHQIKDTLTLSPQARQVLLYIAIAIGGALLGVGCSAGLGFAIHKLVVG